MSLNQSQAVLVVAALFVIGVLVGGLGTHLYYTAGTVSDRGLAMPSGGFSMPPEGSVVSVFAQELDLTPEQLEQARQILAKAWMEAGALRDDLKPQVQGLLRGAADDLTVILTPAQQEKFEKMRQDYRRRTERFLLGPPGAGESAKTSDPVEAPD